MPNEKQLGSHLTKELRKAIRNDRTEKGLCTQCGLIVEKDLKNRATGKLRTMCRACLRKNADKLTRIRKSRSSKGLCERCGKNPPKENRKNCAPCTTECSSNNRRNREARFFDRRARSSALVYSVGLARQLAHLWKRQRGKCLLTGRRLDRTNAEIDHILASSKGGSNDISNLRWVHHDVNQAKGALSDAEFLILCKEVVAKHELS
jgi:HNH endonuclease